jgi:hypothetical protein
MFKKILRSEMVQDLFACLIVPVAILFVGLGAFLGGLIGIIGMGLHEGVAWFRSKRSVTPVLLT